MRLLLGLLRSEPEWLIRSNREAGDGFCDITIYPKAGIMIEVKYAASVGGLEAAAQAAMTQVNDRRYDTALREDGRDDILAYGIAFCKERRKVLCERM